LTGQNFQIVPDGLRGKDSIAELFDKAYHYIREYY